MPIVPIAPPQAVPVYSGFDYVTVDAQRRRVYAAHTGSRALLVVDADAGTVLGQVRVGPMHGIAVDPATGHVFTGNGDDNSISEVDPTTMKVVRSVDVAGAVDAIAYDANGNITQDLGPHTSIAFGVQNVFNGASSNVAQIGIAPLVATNQYNAAAALQANQLGNGTSGLLPTQITGTITFKI